MEVIRKGYLFLSKMEHKRVRGWILGRSPPNPPPTSRIKLCWLAHRGGFAMPVGIFYMLCSPEIWIVFCIVVLHYHWKAPHEEKIIQLYYFITYTSSLPYPFTNIEHVDVVSNNTRWNDRHATSFPATRVYIWSLLVRKLDFASNAFLSIIAVHDHRRN